MRLLNSPSDRKTLYAILGVNSKASAEEIHDAYIKICREHHPDKHNGVVSEFFDQVTHAYAVLSDPEKRKEYDETELDPNDESNKAMIDAARLIRHIAHELISEGSTPDSLIEGITQILTSDKLDSIRKLTNAENRRRELGEMSLSLNNHFEGPDFLKGSIIGVVLEEFEAADKQVSDTNKALDEFDTALKLIHRCQYRQRSRLSKDIAALWKYPK